MPTVIGLDTGAHGNFTVPGGGPYTGVSGTPTRVFSPQHETDPAAISIDWGVVGGEELDYALSGQTLPWMGGWVYITGGGPVTADATLFQINGTVRVGTVSITNTSIPPLRLYDFLTGSGNANVQISPNTWYWNEFICDFASATNTINWSVNGIVQAQQSVASSAGTSNGCQIGAGNTTVTGGGPAVYSLVYRGFAASVSDFSGPLHWPGIVPPISYPTQVSAW